MIDPEGDSWIIDALSQAELNKTLEEENERLKAKLAQTNKIYIVFEFEKYDGCFPIKVFASEINAGKEITNLKKKNKNPHIQYDYEEFPIEDYGDKE